MSYPSRLVAFAFALLGVAVLSGCRDPGGETPAETFELGLDYIRDGDYERVWTLYTVELKHQIEGEVEKQKASLRDYVREGGPNLEMAGQFTRRQYGLSPEATIRTAVPELWARAIESSRGRRLGMEIVGEVRIEGDRATMRVKEEGGSAPGRWTLIRREGRWLIHDVPRGPVDPFGDFRR